MEIIILNNGKEINVNIDYGNGLPYKKAIFPSYEYGDWQQDSSIALIKIQLSLEEINLFDIKKIQYKELHFVNSQFWFDLDEIYMVIHNNSYIYNHIYNKKFAIVIYDNSENEIVTLNFTKN